MAVILESFAQAFKRTDLAVNRAGSRAVATAAPLARPARPNLLVGLPSVGPPFTIVPNRKPPT